jgi:hypothetical protein
MRENPERKVLEPLIYRVLMCCGTEFPLSAGRNPTSFSSLFFSSVVHNAKDSGSASLQKIREQITASAGLLDFFAAPMLGS